jgi:hypothetical protein
MQQFPIAGSVVYQSHLSAYLKSFAMCAHLNIFSDRRSVFLAYRWYLTVYIALRWDALNASSDITSIKSNNALIARQY